MISRLAKFCFLASAVGLAIPKVSSERSHFTLLIFRWLNIENRKFATVFVSFRMTDWKQIKMKVNSRSLLIWYVSPIQWTGYHLMTSRRSPVDVFGLLHSFSSFISLDSLF